MPEEKEDTNAILAAIREVQRKNDENWNALADAMEAMHLDIKGLSQRIPASAVPPEPVLPPVPVVEPKQEPEKYLVRRGNRTIERTRQPEKAEKKSWWRS